MRKAQTKVIPIFPILIQLLIQPRIETHIGVAAIVYHWRIRYAKFQHGNPLLRETGTDDFLASNSEWTDKDITPLARALVIIRAEGTAGVCDYPAFGIKVFTPAQSDDLEKALPSDSSYELYEERVAEPRAALVQRNLLALRLR
jgi:hypothetical protein